MITKKFSSKLKEKYTMLIKEGMKELPYSEEYIVISNNSELLIQELLTHYEASKILLAQQETEKTKAELDLDNQFITLKQEFIKEGLKPTEAKELAKNKLANEQLKLTFIEEDITLLKANIHTIEYDLRLKFEQLKRNNNISFDDLKPLHGGNSDYHDNTQ